MVDGPPLTGLTAAMAAFANRLGPVVNKAAQDISDWVSFNTRNAFALILKQSGQNSIQPQIRNDWDGMQNANDTKYRFRHSYSF